MPYTSQKRVISFAAILLLAACGSAQEQQTDAAKSVKAAKGGVTVQVMSATTTTMSGGFVDACALDLELNNRTGQPLRSVRIAYSIEAFEGWQQSQVDASGEQAFYFSRPPKGKTSKSTSIRGVQCEQIKAFRINTIGCATQDGSCSDRVEIKTDGLLPVSEE